MIAVAAIVPLRCLADASTALEIGETTARAEDDQLHVTTEVVSPDGQSQRFRLWYTLTVDGEDRPTFQSATTLGTVEGDDPTTVELADPINVAPGNYQLDVWVHERSRNDFNHAASRRVFVDLDDARPSILRSSAPTQVAVEQASLTLEAANPVPTTGRVLVQNLTDEPRTVDVAIGLSDAEAELVFGEDPPPTTWTETRQLVVEPLSSGEVLVDELVPVVPGRYRARVELREGDELYDDVIVPDTVDVSEASPAIARAELPTRSLMITDAAVPAEWIDTQRQDIAVTVLNRSTEPQVARVFLSLAPARVEEPWGVSRAHCAPVDAEIPPREAVTVSVSCAVASPVEDLIVSIWVHEVTADGSEHSDGVTAAAPTTVVPEPSIQHRADRAVGRALIATTSGPEEVAAGGELTVTVTIENLTSEPVEAEVWWILYDLTAEPDDEPSGEGERLPVSLDPGERAEVVVSGEAPTEPGTYQLSVAIHTRDDAGDLVHGDQAWAVVPVRVVAA